MVDINVKSIVNELFYTIGVQDNIQAAPLFDLLQHGYVNSCIEQMANYMGLPIRVNIKYGSSFNTNSLVIADKTNPGSSGIAAQVTIPSDLPMYDKNLLTNFPITIQTTGDIKSHPEAFIAIMAHELSHIVLASLRHPKSNDEFYVDITAMMLGFNILIKNGRETRDIKFENDNIFSGKTVTEMNKYGYLNDDQFQSAYFLISDLLNENNNIRSSLIHRYDLLNNKFSDCQKLFSKFKKTLNYFDQHLNLKIKPNDAQKIVEFHQPDFLQTKETSLANFTHKLDIFKNIRFVTHYFYNWEIEWNKQFDLIEEELNKQIELLKQEVNILNRNLSIIDKFKLL
jgi:hypothetical protein